MQNRWTAVACIYRGPSVIEVHIRLVTKAVEQILEGANTLLLFWGPYFSMDGSGGMEPPTQFVGEYSYDAEG